MTKLLEATCTSTLVVRACEEFVLERAKVYRAFIEEKSEAGHLKPLLMWDESYIPNVTVIYVV